MVMVDRVRLARLLAQAEEAFRAAHPRSLALFTQAQRSLLGGVPMSWMMKWAGGFPIFFQEAHGARVTDVDGHTYIDFCLGDTGAMPGHSPAAPAQALARQAYRGITAMLPTADAIWVGEELQRRFGLAYWQFTLTATDANRFAIRIAREITQRPKILVFTIPLAARWAAGVQTVIHQFGLPWHVTQLGCRAEYRFRPTPPRNGGEAAAATDADLDRYMHLFALNRGILLTPFHNMALIAPTTTAADIDQHTAVFRASVAALVGE